MEHSNGCDVSAVFKGGLVGVSHGKIWESGTSSHAGNQTNHGFPQHSVEWFNAQPWKTHEQHFAIQVTKIVSRLST